MKGLLNREMLVSVLFLIFSSVFLYMSYGYSSTPAKLPRMVSIVVVVLLIYHILGQINKILKINPKQQGNIVNQTVEKEQRHWGVALLSMLVFGVLILTVGFILATLIYSVTMPLYMGYRDKKRIALFVIIMTAAVTVIGKTFSIPLPAGLLFTYFLG